MCIYMYIEVKRYFFLWSMKEGGGLWTAGVCEQGWQRAGWVPSCLSQGIILAETGFMPLS